VTLTLEDLGVLTGIFVTVLGAVSKGLDYSLRQFIALKMEEIKDSLEGKMDEKYSRTDVVTAELSAIKQRLVRIESRLGQD
jgi:hypothetical protein